MAEQTTITQTYETIAVTTILPPITATTITTVTAHLTADTQSSDRIIWNSFPFVITSEPTLSLPPSIPISITTDTLTELDLILMIGDSAFSTLTTTLTRSVPSSSGTPPLLVQSEQKHGWDNWSDAEKGGLIAGLIMAAFALISCCIWVRRRKTVWIAPDWWPHYA